MWPEMHRGAQLQTDVVMVREKPIGDMNCVLEMQENNALFQLDAIDFVLPNRQLVLETKFPETVGLTLSSLGALRPVPSERRTSSIWKAKSFAQMVEHNNATPRCRQGRNEQPVV